MDTALNIHVHRLLNSTSSERSEKQSGYVNQMKTPQSKRIILPSMTTEWDEKSEKREKKELKKFEREEKIKISAEDEAVTSSEDDGSSWQLYAAREHDRKFDAVEYLNGFYKTASEDTAMQIVLFFLPGISYYLPQKIRTLLDLGAGPTIYVPIVFRNRAENIYSSDYAAVNREAVLLWAQRKETFDWTQVCQWISSIEFNEESPSKMQEDSRLKLRAIFKINVHNEKVIESVEYETSSAGSVIPTQFQVVVSIFCLEYASETFEEYKGAVRNSIRLIEPGGYLVQGGVLNAKEYSFGGRRFRCHTLTKEQLISTLEENGMETKESGNFKLIVHDDIFVLVSRKKEL